MSQSSVSESSGKGGVVMSNGIFDTSNPLEMQPSCPTKKYLSVL